MSDSTRRFRQLWERELRIKGPWNHKRFKDACQDGRGMAVDVGEA